MLIQHLYGAGDDGHSGEDDEDGVGNYLSYISPSLASATPPLPPV